VLRLCWNKTGTTILKYICFVTIIIKYLETPVDITQNTDPTAPSRKKDHIELAFKSSVDKSELDSRFYYEPFLNGHPQNDKQGSFSFLGKNFDHPIWVSSMTGGTALAGTINKNLAKACKEYGLGMGLGSCRALLESEEYLQDYSVRKHIGDQALYTNLGIAQVEQLASDNALYKIDELIAKLEADGLIIHVNPLQEWLQPEGDNILHHPIETIKRVLDELPTKIIVKEVGQGFGINSMKALLQLPLQAIEFSAGGGTNFSSLELMRAEEAMQVTYNKISSLGHSAMEMVTFYNQAIEDLGDKVLCHEVIVSGGVKDFLDGYYYINKVKGNAIYGQASAMLAYAKKDYESLHKFVAAQVSGLALAKNYLKVR